MTDTPFRYATATPEQLASKVWVLRGITFPPKPEAEAIHTLVTEAMAEARKAERFVVGVDPLYRVESNAAWNAMGKVNRELGNPEALADAIGAMKAEIQRLTTALAESEARLATAEAKGARVTPEDVQLRVRGIIGGFAGTVTITPDLAQQIVALTEVK